jgi:thiamine biosynthesis protein ThiS
MAISVNGEPRPFAGPVTVAALLVELRLEPRRVAVERNKLLVRRSNFEQTMLADGDAVEIVTLVGGG